MYSNRYLVMLLGIVTLLLGTVSMLWYQQQRLGERLVLLQGEQRPMMASPVQLTPIAANGSLWGGVQASAKDTVVQVFSQISEIDLLQPYRTPNQGQAFGSGFFISDQGELLTNAHVVANATSVWIQIPSLGKRIIDVTIVGVCPERDIALLQLTPESAQLVRSLLGKIPYLPFGDSDAVHRAQELLALGYPLAQHTLKSTTGVVSGRENITGQAVIQMSAPINPGSSGGPSLNRAGQVIGINTSTILGAQNANYIIPINEVKIVLDDLHHRKLVRKPFFGVVPLAANEALTEYLGNPKPGGVYAVEIYKKSLLESEGMQTGDMIYEINGHKVDNYGEMAVPWSEDRISMTDYIARLKLGQPVNLVYYRNGKRKEINFTFELSEQLPIRTIYPDYEHIDYEIVAGMVITPLTLNHAVGMQKVVPELSKYLETKEQLKPALLLTHVFPDSQAHRSRAIGIGSVITEVNGIPVGTLDELRAALLQHKDARFMTFKTSNNLFVVFERERVLFDELRFSQLYYYPISQTIQKILKASGLNSQGNTENDADDITEK